MKKPSSVLHSEFLGWNPPRRCVWLLFFCLTPAKHFAANSRATTALSSTAPVPGLDEPRKGVIQARDALASSERNVVPLLDALAVLRSQNAWAEKAVRTYIRMGFDLGMLAQVPEISSISQHAYDFAETVALLVPELRKINTPLSNALAHDLTHAMGNLVKSNEMLSAAIEKTRVADDHWYATVQGVNSAVNVLRSKASGKGVVQPRAKRVAKTNGPMPEPQPKPVVVDPTPAPEVTPAVVVATNGITNGAHGAETVPAAVTTVTA